MLFSIVVGEEDEVFMGVCGMGEIKEMLVEGGEGRGSRVKGVYWGVGGGEVKGVGVGLWGFSCEGEVERNGVCGRPVLGTKASLWGIMLFRVVDCSI